MIHRPGTATTDRRRPCRLRPRALGLAALLFVASAAGPVFAQAEQGDGAENPADESSRRVDESEESFRARMELREQRYREQQRSNTTFSYSTNREGKLANLPPESRDHIRSQLRDLVIDSRLWKPGEDLTGYPYEPSAAAKNDALLARQEREAWVEQLQKYQARQEAAAAAGERAAGPGRTGGDSAGEAGDSGRPAARSPAGQPDAGTPSSGPAPTDRSANGRGVSESALEFLQQRGLARPDGGGPPGGDTPGDAGDAGSAAAMAREAGQREAASGQAAASAGEQAQPPSPPGTVAIAALQNIQQAVAQSAGATVSNPQPETATASRSHSQKRQTDITMRDVPERPPEPGTVDIDALGGLDEESLRGEPLPDPDS